MSIAALRQQLAEIVEGARPAMPGLATGLAALDAVLPDHGFPRGRLTEITGAPGSGLTTLARQFVATTLNAGWWVAYIDAARTLAPRDWAALGAHDGLWVVRPEDAARGAWCADVLLRSGAFGLVVLDGAPALSRPVAVRLVRLARASDAAFVLLAPDGQHAGIAGALQLRVQRIPGQGAAAKRRTEPLDLAARLEGHAPTQNPAPTRSRTRRMLVTIAKGGPAQRVEVECVGDGTHPGTRQATHRVREDSQIPDRRGVARRDGHNRRSARGSERGSERGSDGRHPDGRNAGSRSGDHPRAALGRTPARPA